MKVPKIKDIKIFPTRQQWKKWSLPSKVTVVSGYIGILAFCITIFDKCWNRFPIARETIVEDNPISENIDAIIVITPLESKTEIYNPNDTLSFMSWLRTRFNTKYENKYHVIIKHPIRHQLGSATIRGLAKDTSSLKELDVLLGGLPVDHSYIPEKFKYKFTDLDLNELSIPQNSISKDSSWIGAYAGVLGIAFNTKLIRKESIPIRFVDLIKIEPRCENDSLYCLYPYVSGESSASNLLYYTLGLEKTTSSFSFNHKKAIENYEILSSKAFGIFGPGPNLAERIYSKEVHAGVGWIHDLVWRNKNNNGKYHDMGLRIPDDAIPLIGCISVVKKENKKLEAAREFVKFFLSEEVQLKHFDLNYRLPIRTDSRQKIFDEKASSSEYVKMSKVLFERIKNSQKPINSWDYYRQSGHTSEEWFKLYSKEKENSDEYINNINVKLLKDTHVILNSCTEAKFFSPM